MAIAFSCVCGTKLKAEDSSAGHRLKCPQCGSVVRVPGGTVNAAEDGRAPERNLFLAKSKWEQVYGRPVTKYESHIINAFEQIAGKWFETKYPFEPFHLSQAIKAYAPINATELLIRLIWNTTGAIFGDATAGTLITTQGAYWRNTDGGTLAVVFRDLAPGDAQAKPGIFSRYATIGENRMDFAGVNEALEALVEFLNRAIEMANDDPASVGPTENAVAGAIAARAKQLEQSFHAFVRTHLRGRKFVAAGIGLWPSPRVKHVRDDFESLAYMDELAGNGPAQLPRAFDIGIVGVSEKNLCFLTLVQDAKDLKAIDMPAILESPPDDMPLKCVPRRVVRAHCFLAAEMPVLDFQGTKTTEIRFPESFLRGNREIAQRIAKCFPNIERWIK